MSTAELAMVYEPEQPGDDPDDYAGPNERIEPPPPAALSLHREAHAVAQRRQMAIGVIAAICCGVGSFVAIRGFRQRRNALRANLTQPGEPS
jgi:hypothetical protein